MSDDPTRAIPRPIDTPAHGSVGPADPNADPATNPALRLGEQSTVRIPVVTRTRTSGLWTGLLLSAVVGIFLLIFILQNLRTVEIAFLGFTGSLPIGVAVLFAAIAGLLVVAIPGGLRILQLRRVVHRVVKR